MRILIDTSYERRGPSGTAVYLTQLIEAMRQGGRVQVVTVAQRRRLRPGGARNPLRSAVNAGLDLAWLHIGLPRAARACGADVVHHPLPTHSRRIPVAQVSTVHDVAFLRLGEHYHPVWRRLAARSYRRAVRRCGAIVCVSRATARDVVELLGAAPGSVVVAPHGPGQVDGLSSDGPVAGGPLVFVGDTEPRKNLPALLRAYAAYRTRASEGDGAPAPLVLAGAAAYAAGAPGVSGLDRPEPAALLELLRGARALVHPSLHEGFGLTLLEAMALGVPVVALAGTGTRELCGDAALLVEPSELSEAIERVASDADLRAELSRRGLARAADFSWVDSARAHERAYTLASAPPSP